ncbi:pantoate--beta-alanine ligase [Robiginitomaculum antarcticum]|uniref:pantoate--beta-alanine ligase n=1 Tax=Robiginitomaculum antarcticum TaxID=437507 RepID=UPI00036D2373|nr:pantoate--beta-alanine ligase [Robiginitomaculum antarcticum]
MTHNPIIVRTLTELRGQIWQWRGGGESIGLVPTMGALHDGHLSLIRLSHKYASKTVASIFVNPAQFAPGEDFEAYPRTEAADVAALASARCDLVYIPDTHSMYDEGHSTSIKITGVAQSLETDHRPTFFDGVALVVAKLLNRVAPDFTIFGEKDYQQLATIRRLVIDLDMPVKIIGAPIARDAHGLALSSRNRYFDEGALTLARKLNVIMFDCAAKMGAGMNVDAAAAQAKQDFLDAGFESVDYVAVASAHSLTPLSGGVLDRTSRLLVALHCRGVRLIDNCEI